MIGSLKGSDGNDSKHCTSERNNRLRVPNSKSSINVAKSNYSGKNKSAFCRETSETKTGKSHGGAVFDNQFKSRIEKAKQEEQMEIENMMIFGDDDSQASDSRLSFKLEGMSSNFEDIISYLSESKSRFILAKERLDNKLEFGKFEGFGKEIKEDDQTTQTDVIN